VTSEVVSEYDWAPLFFLSYAHPREHGRSAGPAAEQPRSVTQFFNDLSLIVAELIYRPLGADPGFFDEGIGGGNRWTGELLDAIGACQVFVALVSPSYLQSRWCGMEWNAFSRRTITARPGQNSVRNQTCVIPVRWSPIDGIPQPRAIRDLQLFTPADIETTMARDYRDEGLYHLLWTDSQKVYRHVVWRIAKRIKELTISCQVRPEILDSSQLHNAFEEW
jgi:hypothetical protein